MQSELHKLAKSALRYLTKNCGSDERLIKIRFEEALAKPGVCIKAVGVRRLDSEGIVEVELTPGEYVEIGRFDIDGQFGHWWNLQRSET